MMIIISDESLFVVMNGLRQVRRHHNTEKLLSQSQEVIERIATIFSNIGSFGYLIHQAFLTVMLMLLVKISHQIQVIFAFKLKT